MLQACKIGDYVSLPGGPMRLNSAIRAASIDGSDFATATECVNTRPCAIVHLNQRIFRSRSYYGSAFPE
jgi:hypothetical protein